MLNLLSFLCTTCLLLISSNRLAARYAESPVEQITFSSIISLFWIATASSIAGIFGFYTLGGMSVLLTPLLMVSMSRGVAPRFFLLETFVEAAKSIASNRRNWSFALPHLLFVMGLFRVIAQPPRAGDAVIYHLPRAAFWIQDQGFATHDIPGDWSYYDFFAPAGDFLWSWTMLAGYGDALLWLAYLFIWILMTASLHWLCRAILADRYRASLAVAAILTTPALMLTARSAYVDGLLATLLVVALAACLHAGRGPKAHYLLLGTVACVLAACTKFSGLPMLVLYLIFILVLSVLLPQAPIRRIMPLMLLSSAPLLIWMGWVFAHHESLTWPFQLLHGEVPWLRGDARMLAQFSAGSDSRSLKTIGTAIVKLLIFPLNLGGFSGTVLLLAIGSTVAGRHGLRRSELSLMLCFAGLPLIAAFVPESNAAITTWVNILGRHLLITMTVMVILAAANQGKLPIYVLQAVILMNCLQDIRQSGWTWPDFQGMASVLLPLAIATPLLTVSSRFIWHRFGVEQAQIIAAICLLIIYSVSSIPIRNQYRHDYYALSADLDSYEFSVTDYGGHVEAWRFLDQSTPLQIGFTADLEFNRYSWFGYPYFGTRLQNHLHYLGPRTRHQPLMLPKQDLEGFRHRLLSANLDYLVLSDDLTTELAIVESLNFKQVMASTHGKIRIYAMH